MLPGIRFLCAAIALSISMLVFGLGAAALLRAAHERFVSVPSMRAPPGPMFARHYETPAPTLSLLRVEAPLPEPTSRELLASLTVPSQEPAAPPAIAPAAIELTTAPPEPKAAEPDTAAAPVASAIEPPIHTEAQNPDPIRSEPKQSEFTPEPALPPAARAEPAAEVATAEPARIEPARVEAATEELTRLAMIAEPAPADSSEPAAVIVPVTNAPLPLPRPARASPRTASLGETAATAETAPPKQIVRKRVQAKRVAKRRRQAARIVRPAQPGTTNPFGG